jgi:diaminohydroxyphosphoribosylaminopyrimidine deaminase/5-amino-6-(5-phosphoribosylamino)uracil reductase
MTEFSDLERLAMRRALLIATKGLYSTGENPRVGACFICDGEIVSEGFHKAPGLPHAEIEAIGAVDSSILQGSTCVVTLEPCSHVGKTGPCAEALIDAGVSRVVVAMIDPNSLVAGQGIRKLQDAGIDVRVGLYSHEAERLNPGFIARMTQSRPWIWLKSAASLDGKIAMADGESQWITGVDARTDVQRLRARCQAIVTGIDTVLIDNPRYNVRYEEAGITLPGLIDAAQPLRVILDTRGRLPAKGALFEVDGPILWVTGSAQDHPLAQSGRVEQWVAPRIGQRIDLHAVMSELANRSINEVLVEAGPRLTGQCISDGLVDQGVLYLAPKLLGQAARSLYDIAPAQLADAPEVFIQEIREVGEDLRLDWTLRTRA